MTIVSPIGSRIGQAVFTLEIGQDSSKNSLESLDNMPGEGGTGVTLMKDNRIVTAEKGVAVPTAATPNGIIVGWFLDVSGASDPLRRTKIIVTDNVIEARGETSTAIGVLIDGAIITSNQIFLRGSQAKGIATWTSNSLFAHNIVVGNGQCGVACVPFKDLKRSQNTLVRNDFSLFKASMADVLFQGSGNMFIGMHGKVADNGEGNKIVR